MENENRIGVWIENGKVYRRNSEKDYRPTIYTPLNPDLLQQVFLKARVLYDGATMGSWTASVEAAQDETLRELQELIEK